MKRTIYFLIGVVIILTGCSAEPHDDLQAYINEVKHRPAGQIEPLPEVKPYEGFVYAAQNLRSPFQPPEPQSRLSNASNRGGLQPDTQRRREFLEGFSLDALRMVGTLSRDGKLWAVVKDTSGVVHRVTIGNYIGQNFGHINAISENKVDVTELVMDGQGAWRERKAALMLAE